MTELKPLNDVPLHGVDRIVAKPAFTVLRRL